MTKKINNKNTVAFSKYKWFTVLSIRRKLVLLIMLVSLTAIFLASSTFVAYHWFSFRHRMACDLSAVIEMIGDNCTGALSFNYSDDATEVLHSLQAKKSIEFACIYRPDGTLFAKWQREVSVSSNSGFAREGEGFEFSASSLVVWRQITLNDRHLGSVYIRSDLSELSTFLKHSIMSSMLMLFLSCVIAYILAVKFQGSISVPISSLAETASIISKSQDYSVRAVKYSHDEIGDLTDAFNHMLEELQRGNIALRKNEEELRRVTDNLQESFVYRHDIHGHFSYVSSSVTKVLGYSVEEFLTHFTTYLTDHPVNVKCRNATKLSIQGIQQPPYELHSYHKDGSSRWLEISEVPVRDDNGAVIAVEGIAHDISDRKNAEAEILAKSEQLNTFNQQLKASEQQLQAFNQKLRANESEREVLVNTLKYKNKELRDIVYTTSHDLKSPLVNIEGFSGELHSDCDRLIEMLKDDEGWQDNRHQIEALLKENIPESLGFITGSARKMASLLDGLLQVSRVGTVEIKSESIDINKMIAEVLASMEHQIKENNIAVTVESLSDCSGDPNMIDHVFSNLIGNAIKYRDPDKESKIRISCEVKDGVSIYCVEDNGIGIESEYQGKVFEIFHRLNPNDDVEGEGLGLTIVTRIMDRLGGKIWLESEEGKGSKFFITFPAVE